ncbi:MAG: hypothetical protein ACTSRK_12710 [Promethearchaeota archaeon]
MSHSDEESHKKPHNLFKRQHRPHSKHKYFSAEELAEKWDDKKVAIPRMPFFYINLYQFIMPLVVLVIFIGGIVALYSILNVSWIIQILVAPFVFIFGYFLVLWSTSKFCLLLNMYYEKQSPPREGVYAREFNSKNIADRELQYYHLRGFMYKWPVWLSKKSIFPWMVNFVLRDMAGNAIHKNVYYGDAYVCLEFSELHDGVVIENGCTISGHVVDSIFGNLTLKKVVMEKNSTLNATGIMAPGSRLTENVAVGPRSFVTKDLILTSEKSEYYYGGPAKKSDYRNFLDLIPPAFQEQWKNKQREFPQLSQATIAANTTKKEKK